MNNEVSNLKSKKTSTKTFIIIFDIIIVIAIIISYTLNYKKKQNDNIKETETVYNQRFKCFEYTVPDNLNYRVIDNDTLVISNQEWNTSIDFFGDAHDYIFNNKETIRKEFSKLYNITNITDEIIEDVPVIIFEYANENENGMLCYFKSSTQPYVYEIKLLNKDESYNRDALSTLIPIFMAGNYNPPTEKDYVIMHINRDNDTNSTNSEDNNDNNE